MYDNNKNDLNVAADVILKQSEDRTIFYYKYLQNLI